MSLSDFQKKKVLAVYTDLYDANHDGVIDQADFVKMMEEVKEVHHWNGNEKEYDAAKKLLDKVWEGLKKDADVNKDNIVTEEEWLNSWATTMKNAKDGGKFPSWLKEYIHFMFLANDSNGDNMIDEDEFVAVLEKMLPKPDKVKFTGAFKKLIEGNPKKMLSEDEFEALWKEYFLSDDKGAKGNFLFGGMD